MLCNFGRKQWVALAGTEGQTNAVPDLRQACNDRTKWSYFGRFINAHIPQVWLERWQEDRHPALPHTKLQDRTDLVPFHKIAIHFDPVLGLQKYDAVRTRSS